MPSFVIGIFGVAQFVIVLLLHQRIDDKGDILVQPFEQEMSIGTQELHLAQSLCFELITVIHGVQRSDGGIHTAQAVIQTHPHVVDIPVGRQYTLAHL